MASELQSAVALDEFMFDEPDGFDEPAAWLVIDPLEATLAPEDPPPHATRPNTAAMVAGRTLARRTAGSLLLPGQPASATALSTAVAIHSEFARDLRSALIVRRCTSADVTGG